MKVFKYKLKSPTGEESTLYKAEDVAKAVGVKEPAVRHAYRAMEWPNGHRFRNGWIVSRAPNYLTLGELLDIFGYKEVGGDLNRPATVGDVRLAIKFDPLRTQKLSAGLDLNKP